MRYDVVTYGNEALLKKAKPVEVIDDNIRQLAGDMLDSMRDHNGLGLAAEQIGRTEAICVIDIPPMEEDSEYEDGPDSDCTVPMPMVMINPKILELSGEDRAQEGCLSFPEIFVSVTRAKRVKVTYTDLNNEEIVVEAEGLLSRAIQHEIDHLNGILLIDHMSSVQKVAVGGKLKRLKKIAK
jgi:peptide deformylase